MAIKPWEPRYEDVTRKGMSRLSCNEGGSFSEQKSKQLLSDAWYNSLIERDKRLKRERELRKSGKFVL